MNAIDVEAAVIPPEVVRAELDYRDAVRKRDDLREALAAIPAGAYADDRRGVAAQRYAFANRAASAAWVTLNLRRAEAGLGPANPDDYYPTNEQEGTNDER